MSLVLTIVNAWRPSSSAFKKLLTLGKSSRAKDVDLLPDNFRTRPALVVVLHGSAQSAANYDLGTGWSKLADQCGFVLLMPEQSWRDNLARSFNWFQPDDMRRGGETQSIVQMVEHMVREHDIDPRRIFISGLSAGGAMTLVMLATYPDVFAAGAIIAGLPYGGAMNTQEALRGMLQAPPNPQAI